MILSGWGRFPRLECRVTRPRNEAELRIGVAQGSSIARGNGRAYGDSAMNINNTVDMRSFNRMLAFDTETGLLTLEAGVHLSDVISAFLPRCWFPPVTPGTKFVTIGGMIAADVHGKNHHKHGTFGGFVDWIDVADGNGEIRRCSPAENADLFTWTIGGMGLTGVILRAAFRLQPIETAWIRQTIIPAPDLTSVFKLLEAHQTSTYSVAWVDCLSRGAGLGRSLVILGEHATRDELSSDKRFAPFSVPSRSGPIVPFDFPSFTLNSWSVRAFNACYYRRGVRNAGEKLVDWNSYFYPLDAIVGWNRIYGRKGLVQFQCVLPLRRSLEGMMELLQTISSTGLGSFLGVLKRFGPQAGGLSFPMEGYTLALDFPLNQNSLALLAKLDLITIANGGRFYLAKDSRMTAETLRQSDERVDRFVRMRKDTKAFPAFTSAQSERLRL
jgi:decaprenylphospho-beta-D-ribofuranose 2-oxidase